MKQHKNCETVNSSAQLDVPDNYKYGDVERGGSEDFN